MTIVVDVANVMGSRPDGWWRDRAGAAVRLHAQIARLAASGRAILPDAGHPPEEDPGSSEAGSGSGSSARSGENTPAFVFVLEGAARAAVSRLPSTRPVAADAAGAPAATVSDGAALAGPVQPGEVRVVEARGSGDDTIVAVVRELPGRRVVVTADRELRARCAAAGAEILGPGWLLGLLRDLSPATGSIQVAAEINRATRPVQPGGPLPLFRPAHWGAGASIVAVIKPCPPEIAGYVRFGNCCELRLYLRASDDPR